MKMMKLAKNNNDYRCRLATITSNMTVIMMIFFIVFINDSNIVMANEIQSAPYYMPFDEAQNIDDILANSSLKHFILAFILAPNDSHDCIPAWNGLRNRLVTEDTFIAEIIDKIRGAGGDVSISFGGAFGTELGHACQTAAQLAAAYQLVIDKYKLTHIDLDIEGDSLGAVVDERRRFDAIRILKNNARQNGKKLYVSLTLPTTVVGINDAGREEIKLAIERQAEIDLYSLMAFDFGAMANNMVHTVITVMEAFHQQIKSIHTDWSDQKVYEHTGMILMNGHTDQPSELFSQQTFEELIQYASTHGLSRVSFWAINRDRPCPPDRQHGWAASFCSCIDQQAYDFSRILSKFKSQEIITTTTTTSTTEIPLTTTQKHQQPTTTTTHRPDNDDVDCSKVPGGEGIFPCKNDIHHFIECSNGIKYIFSCPENTKFDPKLLKCVWE
ncbi:chitinase isoform X1 [Dermatophagoides farinae]|uniref:chitinase isoform X1 n=1 Tax=Dermatophagoides farinae TaxID=6954 RepID=UPI003F6355E4